MVITTYTQLGRGISAHVPRSFILSFTGFNYFSSANIFSYLATVGTFHTLAYPVLTIQRRLECQSADRPGMIPTRYLGPIHAFGMCWREEGMRSFYRGYTAYMIAQMLYISVVPLMGELMFKSSESGGNYVNDNDRLYDQVFKKWFLCLLDYNYYLNFKHGWHC